MSEQGNERLYELLASWRDYLEGQLRKRDVPMVTVHLLDVPGAITTKVPSGPVGEVVVVRLVDWAKPTLALFRPPDDDSPFFSVALLGCQDRDVVMICGDPPSHKEEPDFGDEPEDETVWQPIRDRIDAVLDELVHSDNWHFGTSTETFNDVDRMLEKAFPDSQLQGETLGRAARIALAGIPAARARQKTLHRQRVFEHPEHFAEELSMSPDGAGLTRLTFTERVPVIHRILKDIDPCITQADCRSVARAMGPRRANS